MQALQSQLWEKSYINPNQRLNTQKAALQDRDPTFFFLQFFENKGANKKKIQSRTMIVKAIPPCSLYKQNRKWGHQFLSQNLHMVKE